jgi:hypothetical protein
LQLALLTHAKQKPTKLAVRIPDEEEWRHWAVVGGQYFSALFASDALVLPRGVGPTAWRKEKETHIRRRFLLLGQSLETMQVWDTRAALAVLREIPSIGRLPVSLQGARTMSVVALFAALFEAGVTRLELERMPATLANGPSFPNVLRYEEPSRFHQTGHQLQSANANSFRLNSARHRFGSPWSCAKAMNFLRSTAVGARPKASPME